MAEDETRAKVRFHDYIVLNGRTVTPEQIAQQLELFRKQYFNLPLEAAPIVRESDQALDTRNMSYNEQQQLDYAYYNLENPLEDIRIRNKFQYFEHLMAALTSNISTLLNGKRIMTQRKNEVDAIYNSRYAEEIRSYNKSMGNTDKSRAMFMRVKYPALCEIRDLYYGIVEECDIERDRLDAYQTLASRRLSAEEDSTKLSGGFWDIHKTPKM